MDSENSSRRGPAGGYQFGNVGNVPTHFSGEAIHLRTFRNEFQRLLDAFDRITYEYVLSQEPFAIFRYSDARIP